MNIFITGGSGFVGGHLIQRLRADGHSVVAAARSVAAAERVARLGAQPWCGSLTDVNALSEALAGCDAVVHTAAHLKMWGALAEFEASNIGLTRHMLAAARAAGVRHFVHISAASVVMDAPTALVNIDESAALTASPHLAYSWTKARAEELVLAASTGGFRTIALRPPFTWGVGDAVDRDIGAAIEKGRFGWFNGGCYPYATCHVLNLAEAVVCALSSTAAGRAYFITDGEPVELRNFLERRIAAAGLHAPNASVPVRLAWALAGVIEGCWRTLRLRSDPPLTRETVRLMGYPFSINALRARQELGYRPVVSVDEGLNWLTRGGSAPGSTSSVDMVKLRAAARSAS